MMTVPLGKSVPQPQHYSPQSLYPIARSVGRQTLPQNLIKQMAGVDVWTFWECHWLDHQGVPQRAVVQMIVSAESPNIVESKSLKLYLNSLNNHKIGQADDLLMRIEQDLTPILEEKPALKILSTDQLIRAMPEGKCLDRTYIDNLDNRHHLVPIEYNHRLQALYQPNPQQSTEQPTVALCYSHLFRSLCPVTAQPDFALVYTKYNPIHPRVLLAYWISYRHHQAFHEQCIEQMYCDFWQYWQDVTKKGKKADNSQHIRHLSNMVTGAAFTRRGGIDIHPIRYHRDNPDKASQYIPYTPAQ